MPLVKIANVLLLIVSVVYTVISYWNYWGLNNDGIPYQRALSSLLLAAGTVVAVQMMGKPPWVRAWSLLSVWSAALIMNLVGNAEVYGFLPQLSMSLLFCMGIVCLAFSVFGRHAIVPLTLLLLVEALRAYCLFSFGVQLNSHVLAEMAAASTEEIMGFVTWKNCFLVVLGTAFFVGGFYMLHRVLRRESPYSLACSGIVLLAAFHAVRCLACPPICNRPCGMWPVSSISSLTHEAAAGYAKNAKLVQLVQSLPSPADKPSSISTLSGDEGVICILHVGESVRADRLSLNGWKNDTTPWLRQQARLVNYPVCIASAAETMKSFVGIVTNARFNVEKAPSEKYLPTAGSVLDLFAANGFECSAFWGRGTFDDRNSTPFTQIVYALTGKARNNFQESGEPLRQADKIVEFCKAHPDKNLFLLVNNEGSHMPFERYDLANPPFRPTDPRAFYQNPKNDPQKALEANNAYDNTIHYTDSYIKRIVEGVKGRPLLYLYVGDHGEYIGQEGMWMRGDVDNPEKYYSNGGCRVPLLVYVSEELERLHSHFADSVACLHLHAPMVVAHEHVFHTLLGFFGISSSYYDASLDLTSPQAQPYTGPQPQNNGKPLDADWH